MPNTLTPRAQLQPRLPAQPPQRRTQPPSPGLPSDPGLDSAPWLRLRPRALLPGPSGPAPGSDSAPGPSSPGPQPPGPTPSGSDPASWAPQGPALRCCGAALRGRKAPARRRILGLRSTPAPYSAWTRAPRFGRAVGRARRAHFPQVPSAPPRPRVHVGLPYWCTCLFSWSQPIGSGVGT